MFLSPCDDSLSCCARSSSPAIWLQDFPEALLRGVVQPWTTTRTTRQRTALAALANCLFITGFISLTFFFLPRIGPTVSTLLLSATPLLMRVEPLRQDPVPVVAQGEPDEREHVKVEPGDEYLLYERGRLPLLGLCGGGLVCGCCVARGGMLLRRGHMCWEFPEAAGTGSKCVFGKWQKSTLTLLYKGFHSYRWEGCKRIQLIIQLT